MDFSVWADVTHAYKERKRSLNVILSLFYTQNYHLNCLDF